MAIKYKERDLPPAAPLLHFQDKLATTQEINQIPHLCYGLMTGSVWPENAVRNEKNS